MQITKVLLPLRICNAIHISVIAGPRFIINELPESFRVFFQFI